MQQVRDTVGPNSVSSCEQIEAYNDRMAVALVNLLADPTTQGLSLDRLQTVFEASAGHSVEFYTEDNDIMLTFINSAQCPSYGAHRYDSGSGVIYILNRAGDIWTLRGGQILAAQWQDGGWTLFVDENQAEFKSIDLTYFLWRVERHDGQWIIAERESLAQEEGIADSGQTSFEEETGRAVFRYNRYDFTPPCPLREDINYYFSTLVLEDIYEWNEGRFVQVRDDSVVETIVVIQSVDDAGNLEYPRLANWQSYCIAD
jgi:hypothetical protein